MKWVKSGKSAYGVAGDKQLVMKWANVVRHVNGDEMNEKFEVLWFELQGTNSWSWLML